MSTIIPSMWSAFLKDETPEQMVKTMLAYGYDHTELSNGHSKNLLGRGGAPGRIGADFKAYSEDLGFSIPQAHVLLDCDLGELDPAARKKQADALRKWFELFHALDVKAAVLHPAGLNAPEDYCYGSGPLWETTLESLEQILEWTRGMSFTICLENLPYSYRTCGHLLQLIESFRGNEQLGICLDTGHLALNNGNCADFIHEAGSRLKALHITDCIVCPNGGKHDHYLPAEGSIPWQEVVQALREEHYQGLFNYEVPKELNCPKEILLLKLEYSRKLADALLKA